MIEFTQYVGRVQGWRGQLTGLPPWARFIVGVFAVPGLALAALSLFLFLVSILALLLLAAPVYVLLKRLTMPAISHADEIGSPGVKRVEATIVE